MKKETAQEIVYLKQEIDEVERQLKYIHRHSFGFGTSYYDIDETLRPFAKVYLQNKLKILQNRMDNH